MTLQCNFKLEGGGYFDLSLRCVFACVYTFSVIIHLVNWKSYASSSESKVFPMELVSARMKYPPSGTIGSIPTSFNTAAISSLFLCRVLAV